MGKALCRLGGLSVVAAAAIAATAEMAAADLWGSSVDPYGTGSQVDPTLYNKVFRFDVDGNKIEPDIDTGANSPIYPTGMAVAPNGDLFVSSVGTGNIMFYDGQTGAPKILGMNSPGVFASLGTAAPAQLAFGPDGMLYVSEFFGTNVRKYDPSTGDFLENAAENLTSAGGLAFGPDGDLYIGDGFIMSEESPPAKIVRVHEGVQTTFGISDMGMLSSPIALHFLPNGNLLVVDVLGNYVGRFYETEFGEGFGFAPFAFIPPEIPDPLPPGANIPSNSPSDIEFDEHGNLLISVLGLTSPPDNRGAILRYALDGTPLEPLAEDLEPIGVLAWTPSLATLAGDYDQNGTVDGEDYLYWKADYGNWVAKANGADGNGDGIVDAADYTVWRNNLPAELGGGGLAAVPEPSVLAMGLILIGFTAVMRPTK